MKKWLLPFKWMRKNRNCEKTPLLHQTISPLTKETYELEIQKLQESLQSMHLEVEKQTEEMRNVLLECEDLRRELQRQKEETVLQSEESQKKIQHKDALLNEYQKTISEQRSIIEKKQRYINKLETKVHELIKEVKDLLQLDPNTTKGGLDLEDQAMIDSFLQAASTIKRPYDFSIQLQKYIDKVEGLTGLEHVGHIGGKSPRFLDLTLECYAVDKRRLFECFKEDTAGILFIYSPQLSKFQFVNHRVKTFTGWNTEKFMKEFHRLVVQGYFDWEKAVSKIQSIKECSTKLALLNKEGKQQVFTCYMRHITKGPFTHQVLGILIDQ